MTPRTEAPGRGGSRAGRIIERKKDDATHSTRRRGFSLALAAALRRAADRIEARALMTARRRLLRALALDGAFSGPVLPRHAAASRRLDRLDERLCALREARS